MAKGGARAGAGRPGIPGGGFILSAKVPTEIYNDFLEICEAKDTTKSQMLIAVVRMYVEAEKKKLAKSAARAAKKNRGSE